MAAPGGGAGGAGARGRRRWERPALLAACAVPFGKMVVDGATGGLGANPIEQVQDRLGFWALAFLVLLLAPTPAQRLLGVAWPVRLRRQLGLLAFFTGLAHFSWYLGVDQFFDLRLVAADVAKRPFMAVGMATLLLLLPLAVTSTDRWVARLGFRRWKALHRLAYLAAALGVVHFAWRVKADERQPLAFAAALGTLLALRLLPRRGRRRAAPRSVVGQP